MAEAPVPRPDDWASYAEAMRAEVDWAPLHFDGWGHYERARPALPSEPIEVIVRWPDQGYILQYRPLLGELTQARQTPIDPLPEVTVLGRIDETNLPVLRSLISQRQVDQLSRAAEHMAKTARTIPTEPPVSTGSIIPAHAEIPVHYIPAAGRWLQAGRLIHEDHPSAAYAVAGHWNVRLGPPVGLTPNGLLVFQPVAMDDLRLAIEHPVSRPVAPRITDARVGIYRLDGLGGWHQTATLHDVSELQQLTRSLRSSIDQRVPTARLAIE